MTALTTTTLLVFAVAFGLGDCQRPTRRSCRNIRIRCTRDFYALMHEYTDNPSTIDVDFGCSVLDQAKACMGECTDIVMATWGTIRASQYLCEPSRRDDVKGLLGLPCLENTTVTAKLTEYRGYFIHCFMLHPTIRARGEGQRGRFCVNEDNYTCLQSAITASCGNSAASIYVGMLRYSTRVRPGCYSRT